MKKLSILSVSLFMSAFLMAQTDYKLQVSGITVTSANAADIYQGTELAGKVYYDNESNTLTLDNADIEGSIWYHPAWQENSQFTIRVIGNCSILNTSGPAIYSQVQHTNIISSAGDNGELIASTYSPNKDAAIKCFNGSSSKTKTLNITGLKALYAVGTASYAIEAGALTGHADEIFLATEALLPATNVDLSQIGLTEMELVYALKNNPNGRTDNAALIYAANGKKQGYGVFVAGNEINQYTQVDVLQNGTESVQWDNTNKILMISDENLGVQITPPDGANGIEFTIPATLQLGLASVGTYINGSLGAYALKTNSDLTITGNGETSFMNFGNTVAIALEPASKDITLTLDAVNFSTITSDSYTIAKTGSGAGKANIVINGSKIEFNSNVQNINSVTLNNCTYETPYIIEDGRFVDPETHDPVDSPIRINPIAYPVEVAGFAVNDMNKNDVLADGGSVTYDPDNKILTIKEETSINVAYTPALYIDDTDLTVVFEGNASLLSEEHEAVIVNGTGHQITFIADQQNKVVSILSQNSTNLPAFDAEGNDLTFNGPGAFDVEETYANNGIDCPVLKARNLNINTIFSIYNADNTASYDVFEVTALSMDKNLTIDNTDIRLNETTKQLEWAVSSPDKILSVMFIIKPLADDASIWVAGVQVTSMNADDVLGDGTVSYDQAGTLTLKNAYIVAPDNNNAIFTTSSNPLTILVKGNNYLWSENATTVNIMSDLTIKGTGVGSYLNVNADANHNSYGAFYVEGTLTVEGKAGLTAEVQNGIDYPVISLGGTLPKLVVNDADLRASTEYYWATAISCLELELGTGIDFRHDDNDWTDIVGWDETNKTFTGTVKSRIWIGHENFPTDIENVTSDTDKAVKVLRNGQLYIIRDGKTFSVQGVAIH